MKTIIKKGIAGFMTVVMLTGMITAAQPGAVAEAKTKLSKSKATICTGETLQLKLAGAKKVKWTSSKKSVASVDKNGIVTGQKQGKCEIKASSAGKSYSCKLTVKKLPKNYATINGRKVKVGGKVKITYTLAADKPVGNVSGRYFYYGDQLEIVTSDSDKMRFKTWAFINGYQSEPMPEDGEFAERYKSQFKAIKVKGEKPLNCFHQCWGLNPNDPSATDPYPVSCKNGKEFDTFYVKALKSGNFTFKTTFETDTNGTTIKNRVTETIK